ARSLRVTQARRSMSSKASTWQRPDVPLTHDRKGGDGPAAAVAERVLSAARIRGGRALEPRAISEPAGVEGLCPGAARDLHVSATRRMGAGRGVSAAGRGGIGPARDAEQHSPAG